MRLEKVFKRFFGRFEIAGKLYCLAIVSMLAVTALAGASVHFASVAEDAASGLDQKALAAVENSGRLQSLLAEHRQIVESAPAEVDRSRLELKQRDFITKSSQLTTLVNRLIQERSTDEVADTIEFQVGSILPALVSAGQQVMFYAYNFAQDKAIEFASEYAKIAADSKRKFANIAITKCVRPMRHVLRAHASCAIAVFLGFRQCYCRFSADRSSGPDGHARGAEQTRTHYNVYDAIGATCDRRRGSLTGRS